MVIASIVFGSVVALTALWAQDALGPVAIIGGMLLGLGWAFYAQDDEGQTA